LKGEREEEREKKSKKKKKKRDLSGDSTSSDGSSGSDPSDADLLRGGMKSIRHLKDVHRRVKKNPQGLYMRFEERARDELGVVPGQPWTLKDWLRRQPWGEFKSTYRCAVMDCAVYELLRGGQPQEALGQLVQNIKAKHQSVLHGGDWTTAWLITGLPDPLRRADFAGEDGEMSVIAGYLRSMRDLRGAVKTGHSGPHLSGEEGGDVTPRQQQQRRKKKKRAGEKTGGEKGGGAPPPSKS
jgi:hypothetical protein